MDEYAHPAEREAERLRVIIQTLADACPDMTMFTAAPTIFETERKTAELEKVQFDQRLAAMRTPPACTRPDSTPETAAKFVELCQEIKDHMPHKKINAIKELRARTGLGLKEAKDGIEYWERHGGGSAPAPVSSSGTALPGHGATPRVWADWIEHSTAAADIRRDLRAKVSSYYKIQAIKDVRAATTLGLKEAKEAVEEWIRVYDF
jgi:ribosomal protein L7/L12